MKQTSFGGLVRSLRLQNKMTQVQLADRVGVTDKAVSKWERGLSYPDIALFPALADVLGVSVSDLVEGCADDSKTSRLLQIFEMSPDIRTPLHIILGCADMAKIHIDDPGRVHRYLDSITLSGEYLLSITEHAMSSIFADQTGSSEASPAIDSLEKYLNERSLTVQHAADSFDFSGKRILVAEDMEINREIAAEMLKRSGAEVDFAEDGSVCLYKVSNSPEGCYDLILMDIQMPVMDGIETTRMIRLLQNRKKASIPIIAMTANVSEKDRSAAFSAGMNAFIEKPISVSRFLETIQEFF